MTRRIVGIGLVGVAGLMIGGLQARQEQDSGNAPGMPTIARTYVLNRGAEEAVPVTLSAGGDLLPVELVGQPAVRVARQAWEYRRVIVEGPGDGEDEADDLAVLIEAGLDGWEAVGVVPAGDGQLVVLLKRPE